MSIKRHFPWGGWIKVEKFSHSLPSSLLSWHLQLGNARSQAKASFLCLFAEAEVAFERRGKARVSACGLSGFCAWAPTSAWVGSQRLWEHLGVPLNMNTKLIALMGSKCKAWHYLCWQLSVVRSLLPSKCQNLLRTLLLEHASCLRASLSYSRLLAEWPCMAKEPREWKGSFPLFLSTLNFALKPQFRTMGFPSYLVLSVA